MQMRRGRSLWKMESGEDWSALEKVRFLCLLKGGEGQAPSRFGVGPGHRANKPLGLPPCSACRVLLRPSELTGPEGERPLDLPLSAMALCAPAPEWMPAESCCSLLVCVSALNAMRVKIP